MKNTFLVISSFSEKGFIHGKKTVGVAPYTKNVLLGMIEAGKVKNETYAITVLAEQIAGQDSVYEEQGIQVKRVWKRNSPESWFRLLREAIANPAKEIFLAFELAMFGGAFSLIFFSVLLGLLRLFGKKVIVMTHHVVIDFGAVRGHIHMPNVPLLGMVGTMLLRAFYGLMVMLSERVVVFDQALKEQFLKSKKVVVIPHGVEEPAIALTKVQAREKLMLKEDEFALVAFGYVAWYKGTDWLVETINRLPDSIQGKKLKLIIAGGPNPYRMDYQFYRNYMIQLQSEADKSKGKIRITGYVPEEEISLYYQAADCLIFPYRTVFSASGPLSFAFSYKKPFLIAESMKDLAKTKDFAEALKKEGITVEEMTFALTDISLQNALEKMAINKDYRDKMVAVATRLAKARSFTVIGEQYTALLG